MGKIKSLKEMTYEELKELYDRYSYQASIIANEMCKRLACRKEEDDAKSK